MRDLGNTLKTLSHVMLRTAHRLEGEHLALAEGDSAAKFIGEVVQAIDGTPPPEPLRRYLAFVALLQANRREEAKLARELLAYVEDELAKLSPQPEGTSDPVRIAKSLARLQAAADQAGTEAATTDGGGE